MKTYSRPPRLVERLAALIVLAVMGLPSIGHASPFRPTSALIDEVCNFAAIDDAIEARLRCARLTFRQVLGSVQSPASEVVATTRPVRIPPALAGGPASPTPARVAAGAALASLLAALIAGWHHWRRARPARWLVCASAPVPGTRSTDITRRRLALQAIAR